MTPEKFRAEFDPTVPVFIETDGACSGNPGAEIIIHLLGLAPAGYLASSASGPYGHYSRGASHIPFAGDDCLAVPLNLLNRQGEKTSAEEKDYDSGFGRVATCNTPRRRRLGLHSFPERQEVGGVCRARCCSLRSLKRLNSYQTLGHMW
jgi:hypothetical protein